MNLRTLPARRWIKVPPLKAALLGGLLLFLLLVTLSAVCGPSHPGVRVVNDLDFPIAINPRCWSRSVSGADPVFVAQAGETTIHPAGACMIHGPTTASGPAGTARAEGPYLGCLFMPDDGEREGTTLYVSALERDVSWSVCDQDRSD